MCSQGVSLVLTVIAVNDAFAGKFGGHFGPSSA